MNIRFLFVSRPRVQKLPDLLKVCLLFVLPVLVTGCIDFLWYLFLADHPVTPQADKDAILFALSGVLVLYGIVAGGTVKKVWLEYDKVQDLVCLVNEGKKEKEKLLIEVANRKIPLVSHVLLTVCSIFILLLISIYPFVSAFVGLVILSALSFIIVTGWVIALELSDPISGYWIITMSDDLQQKIRAARKK